MGGYRGGAENSDEVLGLLEFCFNGGAQGSPAKIVLVVPHEAAALPEAGYVLAAIVAVFVAMAHEHSHQLGHRPRSSLLLRIVRCLSRPVYRAREYPTSAKAPAAQLADTGRRHRCGAPAAMA